METRTIKYCLISRPKMFTVNDNPVRAELLRRFAQQNCILFCGGVSTDVEHLQADSVYSAFQRRGTMADCENRISSRTLPCLRQSEAAHYMSRANPVVCIGANEECSRSHQHSTNAFWRTLRLISS